jgi:translation initiation factor IF-1
MAKQQPIEQEGVIVEVLPSSFFNVELDNGHLVRCTISGKMRINNIQLTQGDRVKIEMSPYDLNNGRISYRFKQ